MVAVIVIAGPLAMTWVLLHLIGSYWAYWDMGVNPAANSGVLVFLYAPIALSLLLAGGFVTMALARRMSRVRASVVVVGVQLALVAAAFAVEVARTGPSRFGEEGVGGFLNSYVERTVRGDLVPLRRRP